MFFSRKVSDWRFCAINIDIHLNETDVIRHIFFRNWAVSMCGCSYLGGDKHACMCARKMEKIANNKTDIE